MESLVNWAFKGASKAGTAWKGQISLGKDLDDNYNSLKEVAEMLYAKRNDIKNAENRDKTKQLTEECKCWISTVEKHLKEAQELQNEYTEKYADQNVRFCDPIFFGRPRAQLSRRMAKKCEALGKLYSDFRLELVEKLPEPVIPMHAPKIEDKPLLLMAFKDILGHLRNPGVRRVGLLGTVGDGKTTIMKHVNNNAEIAKMFDIVIWLTVSNDWSIEKLQLAIMERLKMNMEDNTEPNYIAQRLSRVFGCKKYLLLLDDVWEVFDLKKIGISDHQNDNKVVLATRCPGICNGMKTNEEVQVQRLSENDAYKMFLENLGQNVNLSGIEPIAIKVARECCCFPLLLEKVAIAFKEYQDDYELWSEGLKKLRRWPAANTIVPGIDELIEFLEFCYNKLHDEVQKACFLYSALYPEDFEIYIGHLVECWRAEDFIHGANKFRGARRKGWYILHDLIKSSLLERSEKMDHVRMNKLVWRMAHKISRESNCFKMLVKPGKKLRAPNEVEWQQVNGVSLVNNKLCTLPEKPCWNSLSTLFLQKNRSLKVIPVSFFECMQNLRILDLHDTEITSLPSSISCLKCLKALYLNSCIYLMDLPTDITTLTCLEILDIRGTKINFLPNQIRGMTQLKCLRLSLSGDPKIVKDILSSLLLLQELRIDVDEHIQQFGTVMKAITEEVALLEYLTSLSICFPDADYLETFISRFTLWKDLKFSFQFSVGSHDQNTYIIFDSSKYTMRRCLKFANGDRPYRAIQKVLAESDAFELAGHKGDSKLSDFDVDNIKMMRVCLIVGCNEIETLVDGNDITNNALISLEEMNINYVAKLRSIWEGPVHTGNLGQLKTLTLWKCLSLKKIFSKGMIAQLVRLQNLKVEDCPEIEEIIMESENMGLEPDVLRSLKTLELLNLPKVRSIWINDSIKWSSLKKIAISLCPLLIKLPFSNENAVNLECIEVQRSWWNALEWQQEATEERLRSICSFN